MKGLLAWLCKHTRGCTRALLQQVRFGDRSSHYRRVVLPVQPLRLLYKSSFSYGVHCCATFPMVIFPLGLFARNCCGCKAPLRCSMARRADLRVV